jgi:hypothetical protein
MTTTVREKISGAERAFGKESSLMKWLYGLRVATKLVVASGSDELPDQEDRGWS